MNTLSGDSIDSFLSRFGTFNDSVLRKVEHRFAANGSRQAEVVISAQDQRVELGWSNVIISFADVFEFLFREGKSTRQVLSDGLKIVLLDGKLWCDFSPYSTEGESIDDFRRSDFYVVAAGINWDVVGYSES
jgi:hypothetical protein